MPEGLLKFHAASNEPEKKPCECFEIQVKLIPHDSEHCLFRILPRYKVRSVGDEVRRTYSI